MKQSIIKALNGVKQWQIEEDQPHKKIILSTVGERPSETIAKIEAVVLAGWSVEWKSMDPEFFEKPIAPHKGKKITRQS